MPTTTPFQNLITFSRGSNATVTGPNGLIQWAPHNLLTFSESFDNAAWSKLNATVIPNIDLSNSPPGPELVTNGDFSAGATGWNVGANTTITGGGAVSTATPNGGNILQQNTLQPGANKWLQVSFDITSWTGGDLLFFINDASTVITGANGRVTFFFLSRFASGVGLLFRAATSAFTGTIDNISIKEVTPAAAIAPDGTRTADTIVTSGTAAAQRLGQNAVTTGQVTFSTYVKAGTAQFVQLLHGSDANAFANFDVATGTLGTRGTGASSAIVAVGNGWYRCSLTFNIASNSAWYVYIAPSASATYGQLFTATVAGLLIWGAQLELGSTATTYNPTTVKNLLGFSEAFDNAAWTKINASIVTGAQANPVNGLFNAQKLMENTATNVHRVQQGFTTTTGATYTFSCYAKAAERSWVYLYDDAANAFAYFNLANGTVGTVGAGWTSTSITSVGNGWYRISGTATEAAGGGGNQLIGIAAVNGTASYTGDGSSGVYIYGAQLSDSASLDPYVPTPGAAPSSTAYYGPRFDYDPVTRQPKGILIEEARTNLLTYSEQFDNASWGKAGTTTVIADTNVSPDGTTTTDTINFPAGSDWIWKSFSGAASTAYVFSIWLSGSGTTDIGIYDTVTGGNNRTAVTLTATPTRYTYTATTAAASADFRVYIGRAFGASNATAVRVWGAQLEAGAFATSYIPTIASTVTRSADVATITGSLFSQWYRQDEGCFVIRYQAQNIFSDVYMTSDGTPLTNSLGIYASTATEVGWCRVGGVTQTSMVVSVAPSVLHTTANAYARDNFGISAGGGAVTTDTAGTIPSVNQLRFGASSIAGGGQGLWVTSFRYIPVRSADFQLQALTT